MTRGWRFWMGVAVIAPVALSLWLRDVWRLARRKWIDLRRWRLERRQRRLLHNLGVSEEHRQVRANDTHH